MIQDITYGYDQIKQPFFIWKERFRDPRTMINNHYHDAYEIYYLLEGERYYFIKDRTYHVQKGDLILIDINELHKTMDAPFPVHERILLNFKKKFLPLNLSEAAGESLFTCFHQNINLLRLHREEQDFIKAILLKMVAEEKTSRPDSLLYLQILLTELLIFLSRQSAQKPAANFPFPNPTHQKISEIVGYLNDHYYQNLSLNMLSEHFFISKYYLSRTFKEVTGFTLVEYLNSVKTKEAQKLLNTTTLSITEISAKVGFESITHFGRVFKSITGSSPLQYRKNSRTAGERSQ
ncbi:MAG TPA: AraC family transcriptional regulator [Firmicutes bacterium]|nr:AraC family transcriptional regulator [Bacillota bacterium]